MNVTVSVATRPSDIPLVQVVIVTHTTICEMEKSLEQVEYVVT